MNTKAIYPEETYLRSESNVPTQDIPLGLPKELKSLCPVCRKVLDARMFDEKNKIFMDKTCDKHGYFKEIISDDPEFYLKMEKWAFEDWCGVKNPNTKSTGKCPTDCGLCDKHISNACLINIDLTNRCNLNCPVCFANSNSKGYVYELSMDQLKKMLILGRTQKPVSSPAVQYAGGEPTIHPQFIEAVKLAVEVGYQHVQVASNGIKFAQDFEFTKKAKEAGLATVYLQFDGIDDNIWKEIRGTGSLTKLKLKAIENISKAGMTICLVSTVVKGVNDSQIGKVIDLAVKTDSITAVSFQPVTFTGRMSEKEREIKRFTTTDLARAAEKQVPYLKMMRDWYPLSFISPFTKLLSALSGENIMTVTNHAHCGVGTYLIINKKTHEVKPITSFIDLEGLLPEMNKLARTTKKSFLGTSFAKLKTFNIIKKYYNEKMAPEGFGCLKFLRILQGITKGKAGEAKESDYKMMLILNMHFQDSYNYEIDRVRRCVIHYTAPDGKIYPFCAYNSGPCHRERVEKEFSVPIAEWKKKHSGEFVTEGFLEV